MHIKSRKDWFGFRKLIGGDSNTQGKHEDSISLLYRKVSSKLGGRYTDRQQGHLISLLSFFFSK
jgi:hypothetical protein